MTKRNRAIYGFTLIELIVSLAIVFILMGISFASYSNLNRKQTLVTAGLTLKNIIRDAQSRAYNREIDCSVCGVNGVCTSEATTSYLGWYVDFTNDPNFGNSIYGQCGSTRYSITKFEKLNQVSILANPSTILFRPSPNGASNSIDISLSNINSPNDLYRIHVTAAGVVNDMGIVSPTPVT